jgi:predicted SPOUT superfamily RNA methylase MTH1
MMLQGGRTKNMQADLPLKRRPKLSVAVPASLVSDVPHLREKTLKIGLIGRALAIFRVDEVIIFPDRLGQDQTRDTDLISTVLSYMETPQYLRKRLFKIRPELRYVGILPPLRTPHHPLRNKKKDLRISEYREGVVVAADQKGILVEIGVEHPIQVPNVRIPVNTRITLRIIDDGKRPRAEPADRDEIKAYWGYKVTVSEVSLGNMLEEKRFDLVVATSRRGEPLMKIVESLLTKWKGSESVLVAFGSPTQGLQEIVRQDRLRLEELAGFVVNTMPEQATETVRTEEALYATLAVLNILTAQR